MVLNNLSGAYDRIGQSSKALAALERAVTLAQRSGDLSGESVALDNLGSDYRQEANLPKRYPGTSKHSGSRGPLKIHGPRQEPWPA